MDPHNSFPAPSHIPPAAVPGPVFMSCKWYCKLLLARSRCRNCSWHCVNSAAKREHASSMPRHLPSASHLRRYKPRNPRNSTLLAPCNLCNRSSRCAAVAVSN
uniref:Uncharacterized protein n=1 Tax=Spumella elongata TaxID=89044 RepID=A0A7S3MHA3_9STRA